MHTRLLSVKGAYRLGNVRVKLMLGPNHWPIARSDTLASALAYSVISTDHCNEHSVPSHNPEKKQLNCCKMEPFLKSVITVIGHCDHMLQGQFNLLIPVTQQSQGTP